MGRKELAGLSFRQRLALCPLNKRGMEGVIAPQQFGGIDDGFGHD